MKIDSLHPCFLCGSTNVISRKYLAPDSENAFRNIGYLIPKIIGQFFSAVSPDFARTYKPILVNKKYFKRYLNFCQSCNTGWAHPFFSRDSLSSYYRDFYWVNRDQKDGQHFPGNARPNNIQIKSSEERLAWINKFNPSLSSVIDFGGGDCAASYCNPKKHSYWRRPCG